MSTALLLIALGTVPALPEELGFVDPCDPFQPREEAPAEAPTAAPAPAPLAVTATASPSPAPAGAPRGTSPVATAFASPMRARPPRPNGVGETMRFQVAYGLLGGLGEVKISFSFPDTAIHASGSGTGSLFGLGRIEKLFEAELRPGQPAAHRWVATRVQSGKVITDTVEQASPGEIAVLRRRSGCPDEGHRFTRGTPVLDPLAFLWRLRQEPPARPETFEVLDGRALWQIAMAPTRVVTGSPTRKVFVVTGKAEPIFWNGKPDEERTARSFTIWIEDDERRTPLRLVMPLAVGQVRVDLLSVTHKPAATTRMPAGVGGTARVLPVSPTGDALVKNAAR